MRVHRIFSSIQGEGSLSGVPMVFVRFQGCSAGCTWCDTPGAKNPKGGAELSVNGIVAHVRSYTQGGRWVCFTGGEPLEQDARELANLVLALQRLGYRVALETNGAYPILSGLFDWVCVSPKPQVLVHPSALHQADEIKFIVGSLDDVPDPSDWDTAAEISLQPKSLSKEATDLCVRIVQERGWRLSLQTHKFISIQ